MCGCTHRVPLMLSGKRQPHHRDSNRLLDDGRRRNSCHLCRERARRPALRLQVQVQVQVQVLVLVLVLVPVLVPVRPRWFP